MRLALALGLIALLIPTATGAASWIPADISGLGSGSWQTACGEDCLGVTRVGASQILFFDIHTDAWLAHDLGGAATVHALLAEGNLVLLVREDRAVAYNALTGTAHALIFDEPLLDATGDDRSFVCGPQLALVMTTNATYVFDAELDNWQSYGYTPPALSTYSRHVAGDDWVASLLVPMSGDPINLAYGLGAHAFAFTDRGIRSNYLPVTMSHGYAGFQSSSNYLVGYSAVTGAFEHLDPPVASQHVSSSQGPSADTIGPVTVYAASWEEDLGVTEACHMYGFDTRHGYWHGTTFEYDPTERSFGDSWLRGGQCAAVKDWRIGAGLDDFVIYDGLTDTFHSLEANSEHGPLTGRIAGGQVFICHDGETTVGANTQVWQTNGIGTIPGDYTRMTAGVDWAFLDREVSGSTGIFHYHAPTNHWQAAMTGSSSSTGSCSERIQVLLTGGDQPELVFYSSWLDERRQVDWSAGPAMSRTASEFLGLAYGTGATVLYDGRRGVLYQNAYPFSGGGIGRRICVAADNASGLLRGYSTMTGNFSTHAVPVDCVVTGTGDLVALLRQSATTTFYYGYDGAHDAWAELDLSALSQVTGKGDKLLFVATTNSLHAFSPGDFVPAALVAFSVSGRDGALAAAWETAADRPAADFRLRVQGGDTAWELDASRTAPCRYEAADRGAALAEGGRFACTLLVRDGDAWQAAGTRDLVLAPWRPACHLHGDFSSPWRPAGGAVTLRYRLGDARPARLAVYDARGRRLRLLAEGEHAAGEHALAWDGRDDRGRALPAGVYLVRLESAGRAESRRLVLLR